MPTYVYKFVKTGETIEVQQSFNEDTLTAVVHPRSGRRMAVKKVFTPVGVTFRGDGFYKTDSRAKTSIASTSKADGAGESTSSTTSDTSTTKAASSTSEPSSSTSKKSDAKAPAAAP